MTTQALSPVRPMARTRHQLTMLTLAAAILVSPSARAASAGDEPPVAQAQRIQIAPASDWERLDRLADIRMAESSDLTAQVREGRAMLDLPWPATIAGERSNRLVVGPGWVRGSETGPRLDVLSGEGVTLDPEGQTRALVAADGVAVRWAGLATPRGKAIAELLISPAGDVTVQYLSAPAGLDTDSRAGRIRAGLPAKPLAPQTATAWRLADPSRQSLGLPGSATPGLPGDPAGPRPLASGPPPAGCSPETGTWCERADGIGTSTIYIQQTFDGRANVGGNWFIGDIAGLVNQWHLTPWAACPAGAAGSSGQSAYHGDDVFCSYGSLTGGSLLSPVVGPINAGTQLIFSSRYALEEGIDTAELYVNGSLLGAMPTGLDANTWYDFNPIDLSDFAGQTIQIEFRFEADGSIEDLGWMVDDVLVWDPNGGGNPNCIRTAGFKDTESCQDRVSNRWDFSENQFCAGCTYTFYVLVECGREMHLPLSDMEGADIQITNVITGQPVPLRCVNQTARADAGTGSYSAFYVPDVSGAALDCCSPAGPEAWYGPALDVTDSAGPGHVRWGLDDGCPIFLEYDANGDGGLDCTEVPATCGGLMSQVSPGEAQLVDCYISDDAGLCGIYRVDITSGGFAWTLFSNCDGTSTPQFQLYHDCTEAWAAYNPLPELAIQNLTTANGCPNLDVTFDVVNLGCADYTGDVPVRITSNCTPQDVLDTIVTGPVPVGGRVTTTIPFGASCSPVRVEVFADALDVIPECTESLTVAACRTIQGVDSLATFTCGCTAQLTASAGADRAACPGTRFTLDGSGSTAIPCTTPEYRWLDDTGAIVRDWSTSPTVTVTTGNCPAGREYTLEVRCQGEVCVETDKVRVDCVVLQPDAGADIKACVGTPVTLDGSASVFTNCANPEYRWLDQLGFEVRPWNPSPIANLGPLQCADAGFYDLEIRCGGDPTCSEVDQVRVQCVQVLANAGPDVTACDGEPFTITGASATAQGCTSVVYTWFDPSGTPITSPSPDPTFTGTLTGCPGSATILFVATCSDPGFENCGTYDPLVVNCPKPIVPVPVAVAGCARSADLDCGVAEAGVTYAWDLDTSVDSDGNTVADDDLSDLPGCLATGTWPTAGTRTVRSWATQTASGCTNFADIAIEVFDDPATPSPSATPACPGLPSSLSCGGVDPALSIEWDFDIAADSSGNGVPGDDVDATTCDTTVAYPAGNYQARVTVRDARGCSASAQVSLNIPTAVAPAEVTADLVAHAGGRVTFTWPLVAGASDYRISRGDLGVWYSHSTDDAAGRGKCSTGNVTTWTDPNDGADAGDYYYLITAIEPCGTEGPLGNRFDTASNAPRDPRLPSASCP